MCEQAPQRETRPMNIYFDLGQGNAQLLRDLFITPFIEVKEREGDALVIGQSVQRLLQLRAPLFHFEGIRILRGRQTCGEIIGGIEWSQFGKELPARPVAGQVVQAQVPRHGPQPGSARGTGPHRVKMMIRAQKSFLGDVARISLLPDQPQRRGINHILVRLHKYVEIGSVYHRRSRTGSGASLRNTAGHRFVTVFSIESRVRNALLCWRALFYSPGAMEKRCFAIALGMLLAAGASSAADPMNDLRAQAQAGDAMAQYQLAHALAQHSHEKKDLEAAVRWYTKAAEQGLAEASCNLGILHDEGRGTFKSSAQATLWYYKAAEQGDLHGQMLLGLKYAAANQNVKAYKWFAIAAAQGDASARALRDKTGWLLTGEEIALARSQANGFIPQPSAVTRQAHAMADLGEEF